MLVRGAPPGALVRVAPFKRKKGVLHARRLELLEPPPGGETPRCAVFGLCGGCALQELPLELQRQTKHGMVLAELGDLEGVEVHDIVGPPEAYGYRNKVELSFGSARYLSEADHEEGQPIDGHWLGFHAPGRFDRVVDAARCELVPEGLNRILATVREHKSAFAPWNVRTHTGFWKHLVLRESTLGQRLAVFYTAEPPEGAQQELRELASRIDADGVLHVVNAGVADVAQGELREVLAGGQTIEERLGEVTYQLSATAFFQTNTRGAEMLYEVIARVTGGGARLLDLYCGTGAIGLYLADRFQEVLGIELNEEAVEDARANATRNGRTVQYVAGPVEANLPELRPDDVAVVDPPRVGLHPKVAAFLATAQLPRLVYVACKPSSLARDRAILEQGGWRLRELHTVDLFPQTTHVEAVGLFTR